jgi:hypothetical protein
LPAQRTVAPATILEVTVEGGYRLIQSIEGRARHSPRCVQIRKPFCWANAFQLRVIIERQRDIAKYLRICGNFAMTPRLLAT